MSATYASGLVLHCPNCNTTATPTMTEKISTAGWITFVTLLIVFFPLCWIGLRMKAYPTHCSNCGIQINTAMPS